MSLVSTPSKQSHKIVDHYNILCYLLIYLVFSIKNLEPGKNQMNKKIVLSIVWLTMMLFCFSLSAQPTRISGFGVNPARKFRIAYVEGGSFINYQKNLKALIDNLIRRGWIDDVQLPPPENERETNTFRISTPDQIVVGGANYL